MSRSPTSRIWLVCLVFLLGQAGCKPSGGGKGSPDAAAPQQTDNDRPRPEHDPWAGRDDLIKSPPAAEPKPVNLPEVTRFELENGLKVRVVSDHAWPLVNFHMVVLGGSNEEPCSLRSLSDFTAAMLTKGTAARSADQIAETIDFVGGSLDAWVDLDGTHISCQVLSKDVSTCLTLMPDVVVRPTFPVKEMGTVRDRLITSVKQVRDIDRLLAGEHFDNLLWGEDHIRGWPRTIKSVNAITRKDLVSWHLARFKPDNALLAMAGDVDPAAIQGQLAKSFGGWRAGEVPPEKTHAEPSRKGVRIRLVDKPDQTQTQIRVGHLGIAHADPDYLPVVLMNYTLGGGAFSSRLMKVVRAEGGKTYGARSSFEASRKRGAFSASTFTRNAETVATLKLVLGEIEKMRKEGPTEKELADAKSNLAGKYPMKFETAEDVASAVLLAELHGLGEDHVREFPVRVAAVPMIEVKRAAAAHLRPDNAVVVLVGKASDVEPQLKQAGMEYEKVGFLEPTTATERKARKAELEAPADPERTAGGRRLLDLALVAKGGADELKAVRDILIKGKGTIAAQGQKFEAQVTGWFAVPDRRRVDIQIPMGTITNVVTPDGAWGGMGSMIRDAPAQVAEEQRASFWRHKDLILLRHRESADLYVQARDPVQQGGKSYDVVEIRKPDGSLRTLMWLDSKTHMLARLEYEKKGEKAFETYDDYRPVEGLMMAFTQRQEGGGSSVELTLSEIKMNSGIPEATFNRPVATDVTPPK